MTELFKTPETSKKWAKVFAGIARGDEEVDVSSVVEGYGSGVDAPFSDCYLELAKQYPEAKVGRLFSFPCRVDGTRFSHLIRGLIESDRLL